MCETGSEVSVEYRLSSDWSDEQILYSDWSGRPGASQKHVSTVSCIRILSQLSSIGFVHSSTISVHLPAKQQILENTSVTYSTLKYFKATVSRSRIMY